MGGGKHSRIEVFPLKGSHGYNLMASARTEPLPTRRPTEGVPGVPVPEQLDTAPCSLAENVPPNADRETDYNTVDDPVAVLLRETL